MIDGIVYWLIISAITALTLATGGGLGLWFVRWAWVVRQGRR